MVDHPTPAELEAFVWDRGLAGGAHKVVVHLIHCEECFTAVAPHLQAIFGKGEPPPRILSPQEDAAYEAIFDRAFTMALQQSQQLQEERKQAALVLFAGANPDDLPEIPASLRGIPAIEALLELSTSLRHEDPERMIRLAEWAWFFAEKVPLPELDAAQLVDYRCKVLIELGNAYRVADDLDQAQETLGNAMTAFLMGTRDKLLGARLMDVHASLYGANRHFDLAGRVLDFVYTIYMGYGETHQAGRALLKKGIYLGYQGEPEQAIHLLQQGLNLIDKDLDPSLVFQGLHNQARFLMDCGRLQDALRMIFEIRSQHLDPGGRINELKVRWVEGQIFAALGRLDRAERALRTVKEGFDETELPYKAALAGLELGAVLLRQGNRDDARSEILPAAEVFLALKIHRETLAVVLLLKNKIQCDQMDAALLDYVIQLLHRAEQRPTEE